MNYTQSIELDLSCGAPPVIQAKQGDDGARIVKITLLSSGVAYAPPAGTTARFRALKPDGYSVDNPAALSAGVVTVELTAQALAVPGTVKADVVLTDSDGDILSTGTFHIIVEPAPVGKDLNSTNEVLTLQALIRQFQGLGSGGSGAASNVPAYVSAEAERVAKAVQSRQNANTISLIVCSDPHYSVAHANTFQMTESLTHMGQAMALIREQVHIDAAVYLGDTVYNAGESNEEALEAMRFVNSCLAAGFLGIPNLRMRGNYENLASESGPADAQVFASIMSHNSGAVYDPNNRQSGCCYRDFDDLKLRAVLVNTNEAHTGSYTVSTAQCTWLAGVLDLSTKGDGWQSVILSHHPLDWNGSNSNMMQVIKAASRILCAIHGHVHGYKVDTITGTEIVRIAIPNACFYRNNEYGTNGTTENSEGTEFGETTTYRKTAGTCEDTAFCVVTIDVDTGMIYADHYGAGYDRVISSDGIVATEYTVTNALTNVTTNNSAASVASGGSYTATLTVADGCELSTVKVTMGGTDITSTAYSGGVVTIASVTGSIVITAVATVPDSGGDDSGAGDETTYDVTNLVLTATVVNGTDIFNGVGYQDDRRISAAITPSESGGAGFVTTGVMPYAENADGTHKTIYIRGATLDTTLSGCRWSGLPAGQNATDSNCITLNGGATIEGNKFETYFTIEEREAGTYYKLTPVESAFDSWSRTIGSMMMSLKGSGAKLVITTDEPIE